MAIWQYQIFVVPDEELNSYFKKDTFISYNSLNEIVWWKYRQINIEDFEVFKNLLPRNISWADDIILFGDESSNCIEIILEHKKLVEMTVRIDLRYEYKHLVKVVCEFAQKHNCIFLNDNLKIIRPDTLLIEQDIANYPEYKSFLNNL